MSNETRSKQSSIIDEQGIDTISQSDTDEGSTIDEEHEEEIIAKTYNNILDRLTTNLESNTINDQTADLDIGSDNDESNESPDTEENSINNSEINLTPSETLANRLKRQHGNIQIARGTKSKKLRVVSSLLVNNDIVQFICENRFSVFLRKLSKSESAILEIAKRLSQYLYHVSTTTNDTILSATDSYHHALITAISTPSSIVGYMDYCLEVDGYQPCSLTVRLDDISNFIHYAPFYESNIPQTFYTAKTIIKDYRRLLKRMQSMEDKKTKSAEAIIAKRTFPVGGLSELRNIMDSDFEYFNSACEQSRLYRPSPSTYRELVGYVLASLWVYSPQGRGAAVEKISLADTVELLRTLSFGSTHSKTIATYKIQPLILQDERAAHIVKQYVDILRPNSSDPQLLLQHNGKPLKQGSATKYILSYFQRNAGYNLGVNSLRRVQCSEVYVASIDGRVTESARKHFNFVQGHSDRINNAIYVKLAMQANTDIARDTFSKLGSRRITQSASEPNITNDDLLSQNVTSSQPEHNNVDLLSQNVISSHPEHNNVDLLSQNVISSHPENNNVDLLSQNVTSSHPEHHASNNNNQILPPNPTGLYPWPFDYLICYNDWGTAHSCGKKEGSRIPWDEREKQCLRDIFNEKSPDFDHSVNKWKQLLQAVIDDPKARPLFHRNHVSDYTRIREGLREKRIRMTMPSYM